jgi:D-apionolactonase
VSDAGCGSGTLRLRRKIPLLFGEESLKTGSVLMPNPISDLIRLYGTDEPVEPLRILHAGALTAEFEGGNLRHIRYHGHEMIRAVSFIVRDKNWGTYAPRIAHLNFHEEPEAFRISYEASVREQEQEFCYSAVIVGKSDGSLSFSGKGTAISDFLTNRTGFVVLHPIEGVAGAACTIEHVDGTIEETRFPLLIDPVQPMSALRAITHEFLPGLKVSCRMEGDTFEMEDQRNWTDASYKTYVRPLALPWPYLITRRETIDQTVTLTVCGTVSGIEPVDSRLSVLVGEQIAGSCMPPVGLGLDPEDLDGTEQSLDALRQVAPSHLVCYYDPRLGHNQADLKRMASIGTALEAELWLEFVIPSVDNFEQDIQDLGRAVTELDNPFAAVMVSPAPDLKCTLPGTPWPPCPPLDACYRAARAAFPGTRLGGGMFSFFTELNRKRPPVALLDFVTFTTVAIFHAGDDRSAMEGLESLPYLAKSVEAFIDGKPYHVGPSAIGLRMNPYGEAPMANPRNIRQAMNGMDPRQRGLFAAAWSVGFVARFAKGGASALTLGGTVGEFGIAYTKADYPQPWFDENRGLYPIYHAIKGLTALRGRPLVALTISKPREIQAIAAERDGDIEIWLANLTDQNQAVELAPKVVGSFSVLSAPDFERTTQDFSAVDSLERAFSDEAVTLPPFAVARLRGRR